MADLRPIHQIVDVLPATGTWTKDRRARWLWMIECAVDYAIEVNNERLQQIVNT